MKKLLSIVLVLMLALSATSALADQHVYNFKDTTGVTTVDINVLGYYLWTVPAETSLHFTTSNPDEQNVFGNVTIENVVFNKYDTSADSTLSDNTKGLGANKVIVVSATDKTDLVYKVPLYTNGSEYKTTAEYEALSDKTGWTALVDADYEAMTDEDKKKYISVISKDEWELYTRPIVSWNLNATTYADPHSDHASFSITGNTLYYAHLNNRPDCTTFKKLVVAKDQASPDAIVAVRTCEDGETYTQIPITRIDGSLQQVNLQVENASVSTQDPATYNWFYYENADSEGAHSRTLYYTCFGTPTLLGTHTGTVTYKAEVMNVVTD